MRPTNAALIMWFHVPVPRGLSGTLSLRGKADLVWALDDASMQGGFRVERRLSGESGWTPLPSPPAADGVDRDGLLHFSDPDLHVGSTHSYRVRFTFGTDVSAPSNEVTLTGWEDSDGDMLPDGWERAYFGTLDYGAADNPDQDSYSNLYEFNNHMNPNALSANAAGSTLIVYTPLQ